MDFGKDIDLETLRAQQLRQVMILAMGARRAEITEHLWRISNATVMSGPFAGMRMADRTALGDGDLGAKLLGCYEQELWPHLRELARRPYRHVINIGCAEGYYAIGLARLLPGATVHALDELATAQQVCRQAAILNQVEARLEVGGRCSVELLSQLLTHSGPHLLVVDCEGAEEELMDPARLPALARVDFVIECHDFVKAGITERLRQRFAATHRLSDVVEGSRNPNAYPPLRGLAGIDRWIIVCENRPRTMNWLVGNAISRA